MLPMPYAVVRLVYASRNLQKQSSWLPLAVPIPAKSPT
jgi:hypothetical protein